MIKTDIDKIKKLEYWLKYSKDLLEIYTSPKNRIKHQTDFVDALISISENEEDDKKQRVWFSRVSVEKEKLDVIVDNRGNNRLDEYTLKAVNKCNSNISDYERELLDLKRKTKSFNINEIKLLEGSIKHSEGILLDYYDTKKRVAFQVDSVAKEKNRLARAKMTHEKDHYKDSLARAKQKLFDIKWAIFFGYIDEDTKHSIGIFEDRIKDDKYKLEQAKDRLLKLEQRETT